MDEINGEGGDGCVRGRLSLPDAAAALAALGLAFSRTTDEEKVLLLGKKDVAAGRGGMSAWS